MSSFTLALDQLFSHLDPDGIHMKQQSMVTQLFKEIAGQSVSEHTHALLFFEGVVTVLVDSGIWAQELTFLAEEYRMRLNRELGADVVTSVRFRTRAMA